MKFKEKEINVQKFLVGHWDNVKKMMNEADIDITNSKVSYIHNTLDGKKIHETVLFQLVEKDTARASINRFRKNLIIYCSVKHHTDVHLDISIHHLAEYSTKGVPFIEYVSKAAEKYGKPELSLKLSKEFKNHSQELAEVTEELKTLKSGASDIGGSSSDEEKGHAGNIKQEVINKLYSNIENENQTKDYNKLPRVR